MLLYQRMTLTRKKNALTYDSLKHGRNKERVTKNIADIQKIYSKKETQLESMKNIWTQQAEQAIKQQAGLWAGGYGNGLSGMYGASPLLTSAMQSIFASMQDQGALGGGVFENMMTAMQTGSLYNKDANGNSLFGQDAMNMFGQIQTNANMYVQQANYFAEQAITNVKMNIQNAVDQMKSQMEEEQEEALLPLKEQETEEDLEKTSIEAQLELVKEELQSVKEELKQEAQEAAPKFGL